MKIKTSEPYRPARAGWKAPERPTAPLNPVRSFDTGNDDIPF